MTIDEELNVLESQLRRLKIEYEIFFSNPQKKPPSDIEWKVLALLRKFSDGGRLSFSQRYRYNEIAQRYAVYSDLWRKKARIREEGYRRPQDALLSVQGVRLEEHEAKHKTYGLGHLSAETAGSGAAFTVHCADPQTETESVEKLFVALTDAKKRTGEQVAGSLSSFKTFVEKKTHEIRKQHGCPKVEYSVEVQDGKVKLRARAKV
ncbi:MAG TPA: MXAN_5187 C-terminal domain-containing protein [Terriglobales bacterium]|nr:MXAN_5187 C-terminal domain-containing protein [Terriglobales bacterium]